MKASQIDEAKDKVQEFMVHYGDGDIWDWYVIGGVWSGTLNSKSKEFFVKAEEHFKVVYPDEENPFLTQSMVEEQHQALGDIWSVP